jgi:hypothetical protein
MAEDWVLVMVGRDEPSRLVEGRWYPVILAPFEGRCATQASGTR